MTQPLDHHEKKHWLHAFHARPSSAVIILEDDQARVLIVKANYKKHWTFPGGIIDLGETPKQAALREIKEEVGLIIDPASLSFKWVTARHSTSIDTYQFIFKAPLPSGAEKSIVLQASEIDEWRLVTKADVLSNDIDYAKTVQLWAQGNAEGYIEQTFGVDD
jgi:8-oxo-dGTP pyrophosphatase MutT (NUDIX family)